MAYRTVSFPITLSDFQGHSPQARSKTFQTNFNSSNSNSIQFQLGICIAPLTELDSGAEHVQR